MLYIFDIGGVVTNTAKIEPQIEKALGISHQQFLDFCLVKNPSDPLEDNLLNRCSNGVLDTPAFWQEFSKNSGIPVKTDWFRMFFHPKLDQGTAWIIRELKQRGNRVVAGTNTISAHYFNHLERGDYALFDQTYSSCFMGVSKPDPEFFNLILQAENVLPTDAFFTDDRLDNCLAAKKLGINVHQFVSADDLKCHLGL